MNKCFQLNFGHGETLVASCSFDKSIRIWNIENGKILKQLKGHVDYVMGMTELVTSNDYVTLVSGSGDGAVKMWE